MTSDIPQSQLAEELRQECGADLRIREEVSGEEVTTFAVGGPLKLLAEPNSVETAIALLKALDKRSIDWKVLGAGSNVLIPSQGVQSVVIRLGRGLSGWLPLKEAATIELLDQYRQQANEKLVLPETFTEDTSVLAFGAAPLMGMSRKLSALGLSGLEFAAGIPGSLGGAIKMNAGAHGHSLDELLVRAFCLLSSGEMVVLEKADLQFGYRRSAIDAQHLLIAAELQLKARPRDEILAHRISCLEYRRRTQPLHMPSAGSVFKNPIDRSSAHCDELRAAAELLEEAGMKGFRKDGVGFSDLHANWLCKYDNSATAEDALWLIEQAQQKVRDAFGITLEPEIVRW